MPLSSVCLAQDEHFKGMWYYTRFAIIGLLVCSLLLLCKWGPLISCNFVSCASNALHEYTSLDNVSCFWELYLNAFSV